MSTDLTRRKLLKNAGIALALIPIVVNVRQSYAMTNASVRAELKYQSTPLGDKSCATCLEFIAGKTDKDLGGCKVIPGDDEISPNGYCTKWNTL
jgi:hypothetical protein